MKKRFLAIILATLFLLSCSKEGQEYSGLNEFEVLDINIDGLSNRDAMDIAGNMIDRKYPFTTIEYKEEDRIVDEIDLTKAGIKLLAEFRATENEIVVLDQEDNNIKVIDWEGNLLKSVGKLGSGNMEFKIPTAFCFDEDNKLYYILDNGNRRIVVIDEDFNFVKNIEVKTFKDKENGDIFNSIVLYKDKIYLSETFGSEKTMAIISIDMDGNEKLYDQKFGGFLKVVDDKLYAIENHRGFKYGKEVNTSVGTHEMVIWTANGDTMYLVEEDGMKKLYDLPILSNCTDLLKIDDFYYFAGSTYGFVNVFKDEKGELKYIKSMNKRIKTEYGKDDSKRLRMQEYKNTIILSDTWSKKIYIIDLTE